MSDARRRIEELSAPQRALLARKRQQVRISRRAVGLDRVPLSFAQEQLWFVEQLAPGTSTYHIPMALRLQGRLDRAALEQALGAVIARHESLRTSFTAVDGRPLQVIAEPSPMRLGVVDLGPLAAGARADELARVAAAEGSRPFRLEQGPLLRALLVRLGETTHVLMVTVHHIVFDGWSAGIFLAELSALYDQFVTGRPAGLAEPALQYADFALWQREWLSGQRLERLVDYWRQTLMGVPVLELPTDHPRPALQSFAGAGESLEIGAPTVAALRELCRAQSVTMFMALLAAFGVLLSRYSGQDDVVVGTPHANRNRSEVEPLIGYFVNMLPVRMDLSGDPSFVELLGRVKTATMGAYAHQDLPFAKIVDVLRLERDPSRSPLFQTSFSLTIPLPSRAPADADGLLRMLDTDSPSSPSAAGSASVTTSKFDLGLFAQELPDRLYLGMQCASVLFETASVRRMLGHFRVLLEGVVADPGARVSELPLLGEEERRQLLVEWNATAAPVPPGCVHELFEAQAAARPEAVAAVANGERISYGELNRQADQVAGYLRGLGVGPEVLVGVCMRRSLRRVAAVLGVLKAGGAYVPLDPAHPAERLGFMISDSSTAVVLAERATVAALGDLQATGDLETTVVCLDTEWERVAGCEGMVAAGQVGARNLAYVIYTSGSTGQPKGVLIEHRSVLNYIVSRVEEFGLGPDDRVLQLASLSFDVSVFEMFVTLASGATLCLATEEALGSPLRLAGLLRDQRVSLALLPPPVASLLAGDAESFVDLRVVIVGGEAGTPELVRAWVRPGRRFYNGYGPTEATVAVTVAQCRGDEPQPPIGRPMANQQVYVLDRHLNPVPVGVAGQLYVSGVGLARGYLNRPELTADRFIPNPFVAEAGARLYATGDLVRYLADGNLVFLGRLDDQVKIRGFRVELGEIEAVLRACPGVVQAVVVARDDLGGQRQLVGYVTVDAAEVGQLSPAGLRRDLARRLPGYMVPAHVVVLDTLPLTPTGKVDRKALPAPVVGGIGEQSAPRTLAESLVADLFAEVLGVGQVGVDDGFFDLGGNSLQAMQLLSRLRDTFDVEADLIDIFQAPTTATLAATVEALRQKGVPTSAASPHAAPAHGGPLVRMTLGQMTQGAERDPLFFVHAVSGTVHAYAQLATHLADTHTLYGIEAAGLREGSTPHASVEDMAVTYLQAIRQVQPHGPYRLGGWSMGGLVAFEIARRLETAGDEVALLTLLDTAFPGPLRPALSDGGLATIYVADAAASLGRPFDPPPDFSSRPVPDQLRWMAERLGPSARGHRGQPGGELELARRFAVFKANVAASSRYRPQTVRAPTLVIDAAGSPNQPAAWAAAVTGECTVVRVPGDHYTLLKPPAVQDVAVALRAALS